MGTIIGGRWGSPPLERSPVSKRRRGSPPIVPKARLRHDDGEGNPCSHWGKGRSPLVSRETIRHSFRPLWRRQRDFGVCYHRAERRGTASANVSRETIEC